MRSEVQSMVWLAGVASSVGAACEGEGACLGESEGVGAVTVHTADQDGNGQVSLSGRW